MFIFGKQEVIFERKKTLNKENAGESKKEK